MLTVRDYDTTEAWERADSGLYLPPRPQRRHDRPIAVDLFCGAGGFGCGFHQAGYYVAAAVEWDVAASLTYLCNLARPGVKIHVDPTHPIADGQRSSKAGKRKTARKAVPFDAHIGTGWISNEPPDHPGCEHFYLYDVRNLTGQRILDDLGLEVGEVDCVTGGPPCQGYSVAGKRDVMDPRNSLVFEFARLVCEIRPKTFVMENVVGMTTMRTPEGIPVIDALCAALSGGGYGDYEALRNALAGAPQAKAGVRDAKAMKKHVDDDPPAVDEPTLFEVTS
ncbi:DNA cytosine methyltransferase [Mycobacterium talmoniae]|uniref:DNA (cytosine-5-)-methyltransferase n=1 Tax=Mycobacterium talmoniae TaxID=1858794 RepID=A0A1S1NIM8_9MYCO|nr:DNA cytosine methyltransferase [Mycobacterium talmoniae]OHV03707.1 hypothetical protein BKN37_13620 [Mycobacterium talmoniae]